MTKSLTQQTGCAVYTCPYSLVELQKKYFGMLELRMLAKYNHKYRVTQWMGNETDVQVPENTKTGIAPGSTYPKFQSKIMRLADMYLKSTNLLTQ
jgi:hypothetical protein